MAASTVGRIVDEPLPVGMRVSFGTNREALAKLLHAALTKADLGIEPLAAHSEANADKITIAIGPKR
jgi:hypothetical protein